MKNNVEEWVVDMIITDTDANTVESALNQWGVNVRVKRMTHWEIVTDKNLNYSEINNSGVLFNSNKEYVSNFKPEINTATFLVRFKEDMLGVQKKQSLIDRFNIEEISEIRHGVLWNIKVISGDFERVIKKVLDSQILFNPLSQECYKYE